MSLIVRLAVPGEYAEAGRVTAEGYHADDLLRRPDGLIDPEYEARLADADRRARMAVLMVAVDDGKVLARSRGVRPHHHCGNWLHAGTKQSSGCSRWRQLDGDAGSAVRLSSMPGSSPTGGHA